MARDNFTVRQSYTGNGSQSAYDFDFKIESLSQLLIIELDDSGVETQNVRGTDVTYLASVTFDAVEGGGTVNLAANLTSNYKLILLLANDSPTQPNEFKNKSSFTLRSFEMALDWLGGPIQRLAYLASRSFRLPESIETASFDCTLPADITTATSRVIVTKSTGDGLEMGPDTSTIEGAIAAAEAAETASEAAQAAAETAQAGAEAAQAAAETAQAGAEAAQAAAEAVVAGTWSDWVPHAVTNGQSATALTDETWLSASVKEVRYEFAIIRGTTVNASGYFVAQKQNGSWRIRLGSYMGEVHGVTFSLTGTTTQQLNAALDSGAGDGEVILSRRVINE